MATIGCCNDFKKCSDEAKCIKKNEDYVFWDTCLYEENLKKGLNFYTTYNENNAARKMEYELQINATATESKTEVKTTKETRSSDHNYIGIDGRYFVIGKKSSYQGYTLFLEKDVKEELDKLFRRLSIEFTDTPNEKLFLDENWSDDNPAWYRPILCIGPEDQQQRYNISNYNYRALTDSTAKEIKAFFNDAGLTVMIETIGRGTKSTSNYHKPKTTTHKASTHTKAPNKEIAPTPPVQQLSFEDLGLCI